jgi:hypothetical protein
MLVPVLGLEFKVRQGWLLPWQGLIEKGWRGEGQQEVKAGNEHIDLGRLPRGAWLCGN